MPGHATGSACRRRISRVASPTIADILIPVLQERGLFSGANTRARPLRETLGLERPANQYVPPARKAALGLSGRKDKLEVA